MTERRMRGEFGPTRALQMSVFNQAGVTHSTAFMANGEKMVNAKKGKASSTEGDSARAAIARRAALGAKSDRHLLQRHVPRRRVNL